MFEQLKRNIRFIKVAKNVLNQIDQLKPDSPFVFPDLWEKSADRYADRIALSDEQGNLTYAELDGLANQFAQWALGQGYSHKNCVALVMENRCEFVAAWFGLSKVGVRIALINPSLNGQSLAHCIKICEADSIICDASQDAGLVAARPFLDKSLPIWNWGGLLGQDLQRSICLAKAVRPDPSYRSELTSSDVCLFIFTSGTTGMPKAAKMSHLRVMISMKVFLAQIEARADDVMYNTLPLYHATGGLCALGISLLSGGKFVMRKKFSKSRFWKDVREEGATLFSYIGEICRYLEKAPRDEMENQHNLRAAFGNGLAADVWERFQCRFNVPFMLEMYASTEGNTNMANFDGKPGAVGRLPSWLPPRLRNTVRIVRTDPETGEPLRDKLGFCIRAKPDEVGEMIGRIGDAPRQRFEGYEDSKATQKKILQNVFSHGDQWFRTGDLMRQDRAGYFYFIDRTGDTLRWKGENVATTEVGSVIAQYAGVETANVYGVKVPGCEGRVGMASITLTDDVDWDGLREHLRKNLPGHAIPRFIRHQKSANITTTFKLSKVQLKQEGFDPEQVTDPLMYLDPSNDHFEPVTPDLHKKLVNGGVS